MTNDEIKDMARIIRRMTNEYRNIDDLYDVLSAYIDTVCQPRPMKVESINIGIDGNGDTTYEVVIKSADQQMELMQFIWDDED